jgi:protein TonB
MRRDLIISFLFVLSIHVGLVTLWHKGSTKRITHEDDDPVVKIELPPVEQDVEQVVNNEPTEAQVIAPPSFADVPSTVPIDAFVTPVEPPPVTGLHATSINVAVTRTKINGAIFNLADLDQQPELILKVLPQYPFDLKRSSTEGNVMVGFICDSDGHVQEAHVIKSSGYSQMDQNAVEAVTKCVFKPGRKGGHAVNTRMQVPIAFTIGDN